MRPRISIRGSVCPSVGRSVGNAFFLNSENEELSWKKKSKGCSSYLTRLVLIVSSCLYLSVRPCDCVSICLRIFLSVRFRLCVNMSKYDLVQKSRYPTYEKCFYMSTLTNGWSYQVLVAPVLKLDESASEPEQLGSSSSIFFRNCVIV